MVIISEDNTNEFSYAFIRVNLMQVTSLAFKSFDDFGFLVQLIYENGNVF